MSHPYNPLPGENYGQKKHAGILCRLHDQSITPNDSTILERKKNYGDDEIISDIGTVRDWRWGLNLVGMWLFLCKLKYLYLYAAIISCVMVGSWPTISFSLVSIQYSGLRLFWLQLELYDLVGRVCFLQLIEDCVRDVYRWLLSWWILPASATCWWHCLNGDVVNGGAIFSTRCSHAVHASYCPFSRYQGINPSYLWCLRIVLTWISNCLAPPRDWGNIKRWRQEGCCT